MIEILAIEQKCKLNPVPMVAAGDFAVRPERLAEPDLLLRDPHLSPYCLDDVRKRVLFVETAPDVEIATFPFLYMAQYEHAQRLVAVPYTTMHTLAAGLPASQVPLVFIYSPAAAARLS